MQVRFQRKNGYYRMEISNKETHNIEKKENMTLYYDDNNQIIAIDFYPPTEK